MRLKFWKWVHARLEQAWHWVYYAKLEAPHLEDINANAKTLNDFQYHVYFANAGTIAGIERYRED